MLEKALGVLGKVSATLSILLLIKKVIDFTKTELENLKNSENGKSN